VDVAWISDCSEVTFTAIAAVPFMTAVPWSVKVPVL
jgi:hypothetical protein